MPKLSHHNPSTSKDYLSDLLQEDEEEKENAERALWTGFVYERGVSYRVGDAVFLTPKATDTGNSERKMMMKTPTQNCTESRLTSKVNFTFIILNSTL